MIIAPSPLSPAVSAQPAEENTQNSTTSSLKLTEEQIKHNEEERWLELQFYALCKQISMKTSGLEVLSNLLTSMAFYCDYNVNALQQVALKCLTDPAFKPRKHEIVIIGLRVGAPRKQLMKYTGLHPMSLSRIKKADDDALLFPRLTIGEREIIRDFFKNITFLKECL